MCGGMGTGRKVICLVRLRYAGSSEKSAILDHNSTLGQKPTDHTTIFENGDFRMRRWLHKFRRSGICMNENFNFGIILCRLIIWRPKFKMR
jgi:hypothetical protein